MNATDFEKLTTGWLDDPKNINIGKARIIWCYPDGIRAGAWALPGGTFTTIREKAEWAASFIAAAHVRP